jgi:hypothetical protein
MVSSLSANFDQLEYNLTIKDPFIKEDDSIINTINCLVKSFNLYYNFIQNNILKLHKGLVLDIKDHAYSLFLNVLISKLNSTKDNNQDILDHLSLSPNFFTEFAEMLNYVTLDVSSLFNNN